jgi:hypothetical protein
MKEQKILTNGRRGKISSELLGSEPYFVLLANKISI